MDKVRGLKQLFIYCLFGVSMSSTLPVCAQQVRLDNLKEQFSKKNLFRINGGLAANGVFYTGDNSSRQPFMWVISGNVNISIYDQVNLPFSCNFNNLGNGYNYPTLPNRLSIHPSYKWVTAHIGDVSMSFSPYTLSGHQFTGAGLELKPENFPLKAQFMFGRLLKKTEYDSLNFAGIVAYKRMGYGVKLNYEKEKYLLGISVLHAHDDPESLKWKPDSLQIYPQSNLALSGEVTLKLLDNLTVNVEYGFSSLTRDMRLPSVKTDLGIWLLTRNTSTVQYHALKAGVNYLLKKNSIGLGYERIDPDYRTLGGYYFTNDFENFTFNYARPFWKDKINFSMNVGMQHDNLNRNKTEQTNRWVIAANLNIVPTDKLNCSVSYSSFQSYTNIRSQFDYINATNKYENQDTLDFTQLSQNVNVNIGYNWAVEEVRSHNLNFNLSFQEAADKRGGIIAPGSASRFYNLAASYALLFVPSAIQLTASGNLTYNKMAGMEMITWGPNLGASSKFLKNKMTVGVSSSYNVSSNSGIRTGSVFNARGNVVMRFFKHHTANISVVYQNRDVPVKPVASDFTTTLNYAYSF